MKGAVANDRRDQVSKAAQAAYESARRPRAAVITQVPAVAGGMRPVVIHHRPKPITWKEARERGLAYARVLDGRDKWPDADALKKYAELDARDAAVAKARKARRRPHPWTDGTIAIMMECIDRRIDKTVPAYSRRGRKLAREAKRAGAKESQ